MIEKQLYGTLPVYQIHFFVKGRSWSDEILIARTRHKSSILDKKVIEVHWEGGMLANDLNSDKELTELLKIVLLEVGDIFVEPVKDGVRIHSRWMPIYAIRLSKDAIKAYNMIARHVKKHLRI